MQINVSQLLRENIGSTRECEIDEVADIGNGKENLFKGRAKLLRTQRGILAGCIFDTNIELECSRCLGPFQYALTLNFEEEYLPTVDVMTGAPLPAPEEASVFTIDKHHILDLTEATRQYTLLAIPIKPLCSDNCAGLCPSCGGNLNEGQCNCSTEDIDPRLSELKKLL
jgi:uncharacterized protein